MENSGSRFSVLKTLEGIMKQTLVLVLTMVFVGIPIATPMYAHHGAASFDVGKTLTLKGTVKEWLYSNPIACSRSK